MVRPMLFALKIVQGDYFLSLSFDQFCLFLDLLE